jgi:hypothetical protein
MEKRLLLVERSVLLPRATLDRTATAPQLAWPGRQIGRAARGPLAHGSFLPARPFRGLPFGRPRAPPRTSAPLAIQRHAGGRPMWKLDCRREWSVGILRIWRVGMQGAGPEGEGGRRKDRSRAERGEDRSEAPEPSEPGACRPSAVFVALFVPECSTPRLEFASRLLRYTEHE